MIFSDLISSCQMKEMFNEQSSLNIFYFTSLEFGNMIRWCQEPAIKISLIVVHFHIIGLLF